MFVPHVTIAKRGQAKPRSRVTLDDMVTGWTSGTLDATKSAPLATPNATPRSRQRTTSGTSTMNFFKTYSAGSTLNFSDGNPLIWLYLDDPRSTAEHCQAGTNGITLQFSSDANVATGCQITFTPGSADVMLNQKGRWFACEFPNHYDSLYTPTSTGGLGMWGLMTSRTAPDFSAINWVRVIIQAAANGLGANNPWSLWMGGIEKVGLPPEPVVSIHFDRNDDKIYTVALPVLSSRGIRATVRGNVYDYVNGGGGNITQAHLLSLQNEYGWEIGFYDYQSGGFIAGENNFGDDQAAVAPVPWQLRSKASVLSDYATGKQALLDLGLTSSMDQLAGQARKLTVDGWDDITTTQFRYSDHPISTEQPLWWPTFDFGTAVSGNASRFHAPTFMHTRSTMQNVPISDSTNRLRKAILRAQANKEWLRILFHTVDSTTPSDGFSILAAELGDLCDFVTGLGVKFRTSRDVRAGRV